MFSINTINRVNFRKDSGLWVYDDAKFGLKEQPLVFGMDLILEKMIKQIEGVKERLNLVFSSIPFPYVPVGKLCLSISGMYWMFIEPRIVIPVVASISLISRLFDILEQIGT